MYVHVILSVYLFASQRSNVFLFINITWLYDVFFTLQNVEV